MKSEQIRETFLRYFESCGYHRVDSASVVPAGDPTLLFTNAGMVPFKQYFLGDKAPNAKACSSQKCVRAGGKHNDLEQVGLTARHHTFFEMLGNFVFSGANKETAIKEAWELLTEGYGIPKERLWVTVYHEDKEARDIWHRVIGLEQDRIIDCGEKDNFWSMGDVGPCGPCTEIFYDHGEEVEGGLPGSPNEDGDRYVEIWNLVFMQYEMLADGSRKSLPSMGLDTGMGLERITAVLQDVHNNFDTDVFMPMIIKAQALVKGIDIVSARVIADHVRTAVFLISDQVYPSNEGRGYVLRRIIRRAIGFGYRCGMEKPFLIDIVPVVVKSMKNAYPDIEEKMDVITSMIREEEAKFLSTIRQGMVRIQVYIDQKKPIDGKTAFEMYDTYGFPLDLIRDICQKYEIALDEVGYKEYMEEQRTRSRENQQFAQDVSGIKLDAITEFTGYMTDTGESEVTHIIVNEGEVSKAEGKAIVVVKQTPFYAEGGGEVGDIGTIKGSNGIFHVNDTQRLKDAILHFGHMFEGTISVGDKVHLKVDENRKQIAANHSATHLLHAALREVLGSHVVQKGSLVTADRLRFDFAHKKPMTIEEIALIERRVNEEIQKDHSCDRISMPLAEAKKAKVMALFDEKYEDPVNVISFGDFSKELCGGMHVPFSIEIGLFKIISETGIASGVRRIEAITGMTAIHYVLEQQSRLNQVSSILKCEPNLLVSKVEQITKAYKASIREYEQLQKELYMQKLKGWVEEAVSYGDYKLLFQSLDKTPAKTLRMIMDLLKSSIPEGLIILQSTENGKTSVLIGENGGQHASDAILKIFVEQKGGRGGGRANLSQGVLDAPIDKSDLESILN